MAGDKVWFLYWRWFRTAFDAVQPFFDAVDAGVHDRVVVVQAGKLNFNGCQSMFHRVHAVFDLPDTGAEVIDSFVR